MRGDPRKSFATRIKVKRSPSGLVGQFAGHLMSTRPPLGIKADSTALQKTSRTPSMYGFTPWTRLRKIL